MKTLNTKTKLGSMTRPKNNSKTIPISMTIASFKSTGNPKINPNCFHSYSLLAQLN
ncbi:hypothetical protein CsSME_00001026 [Camellia sinensis var. sinensis]